MLEGSLCNAAFFSTFNVELFDGWYKNSLFQRMDKLAHSVYINWSGKEFKNGVLLPLPVWEEC